MPDAIAHLNPLGGEVVLDLLLGDGLICEWTVRVEGETGAARTFTGSTTDPLPDHVKLPPSALPEGTTLTYVAVFFGPSKKQPYHWALKMSQGGKSVLAKRLRGGGEVKARRTRVVFPEAVPPPTPTMSTPPL